MIKAKIDQSETPQDTYGFGFMKALNKNGVNFPLHFKMKNLNSKISLMCRDPMASGFLHILLGSILYGDITWGRFLIVSMLTIITLIGVNMEERQLKNLGDSVYLKFLHEVPTKLIPDYRVIF